MSADRSVCTECLGPKPRPDRNTCGAPLCVESARLLTAHRKAREAARAFRGLQSASAARCHTDDRPRPAIAPSALTT